MTFELKPERVWYYFEKISAIPRESGHEKAVSDYIKQTIENLGLKVIQEPCLNIIAYKDATAGKENAKSVMLQGHMDMVCVKDDDCNHDFAIDAIKLKHEGDFILAEGTTLGADNGIAVAMMLAILESNNIVHPKLTCLFTVEEETTMKGAEQFDVNLIDCDIIINLDSEEEGVALASNAGGETLEAALPIQWRENTFKNAYKITIKGLQGGHSGSDINQHRASAIKLLGRLIEQFDVNQIGVFNVEGGQKMNAIAKNASCYIMSDLSVNELMQLLTVQEDMFINEYGVVEPTLGIVLEKTQLIETIYSKNTQKMLSALIKLTPQGVQTMSKSIEGLVESSNNIGVLNQTGDAIIIGSAIRSSVKSFQDVIAHTIQVAAELTGASTKRFDSYPAWPFSETSEIRELFCNAYQSLTGEAMKVEAVHAGLECGTFAERFGKIDMISVGPQMYDVHTPRERVSISSTESTYRLVLKVLEDLN